MKLSLEEIQGALAEAKVPTEQQTMVIDHLQEVIKELEAEKIATKLPSQKNEFGVIIFDKNGVLKGQDFVAAVYTIPQGEDHDNVLRKISEAARDQNEAAKRKKHTIESMGEACESVKRKFIKQKNVNIKSKAPVRVLVSDNKLV
ncbi:MAG: hypothetical protein EBU33_05925 [Sphingobacteriia bacterium]|nr:hypothetical protein [Sphingobacteriia bacterium]